MRVDGAGTPPPAQESAGAQGGRFWKFVTVWGLALGTFALARPLLFPMQLVLPEGFLPEVGQVVDLPTSFLDQSGREVPALATAGPTLFLVTSATCGPCHEAMEGGEFAALLRQAAGVGMASRMLVIPADTATTGGYLAMAPPDAVVVIDSMRIGNGVLGSRITPAAVLVSSEAEVLYAGRWPPDWQDIAEAGSRP